MALPSGVTAFLLVKAWFGLSFARAVGFAAGHTMPGRRERLRAHAFSGRSR
jgi:hypothetical protein